MNLVVGLCWPLTDRRSDVSRKGREKEVSEDPVGFGRDPAKSGVRRPGLTGTVKVGRISGIPPFHATPSMKRHEKNTYIFCIRNVCDSILQYSFGCVHQQH